MQPKLFTREFLGSETAVLFGIALVPLILHLIFIDQYGYFRDEFYCLACGEHLDWGYVDHPRFIALVAFLISKTLGTSLLAIRFLPALAVAAVVVLSGNGQAPTALCRYVRMGESGRQRGPCI